MAQSAAKTIIMDEFGESLSTISIVYIKFRTGYTTHFR